MAADHDLATPIAPHDLSTAFALERHLASVCECHVASVLRDVCVVHRGWRFVCTCVQQTRSALRRREETKAEVYEGT